MKRLSYLFGALVLSAVLGITGCGSDEDTAEVDAKKEVTKRLSKKWKLDTKTSTMDEAPVLDLDKLEVTFADGTYTTNGNGAEVARKPNPWPPNGTWKFKAPITAATASAFVITRDDELDINVSLGDDKLVLTFTFEDTKHKNNEGKVATSSSTSREEAVKGKWVMTFGL